MESHDDYSVFEYYLASTFDFRQEILRHGPQVEVLSPQDFREEVMEDIRQMAEKYGQTIR